MALEEVKCGAGVASLIAGVEEYEGGSERTSTVVSRVTKDAKRTCRCYQ